MVQINGNGFIITGGLGGVGKAVATSLLKAGGWVALFDVIPQEKGDELTKAVDAQRAFYFQTDISNPDSVKAAVASAVQKLPKGKLVGGVHCAGIALKRKWTMNMADSIADFKKMLDVNTFGTFVFNAHVADAISAQYPSAKEDLPARVDEERGVIINFASAAAEPSAVLGITTSVSDYLGPVGIRVNAVSPSIVNTGMAGPFMGYFQSELDAAATFPRRQASLDEIWEGCKFLIEHGMINGLNLKIDGGWRLVSNWNGGKDPRAEAPGLE
ncbi:hypothetical protein MNV49_001820 [Pseudohyphozyma bogoriensis]|nr:hypothetical protein MNV49_001820 [Pseudohyphozyma bogoriensis]